MLLNIGYETFVPCGHVSGIVKSDGSSMKKLRHDSIEHGLLIDATYGHKTRSMIVLTSRQIYLSSVQTTTLQARYNAIQKQQQKL